MKVPLFCFGSATDARRVFVGKRCIEQLPLEERGGLGSDSLMRFLEDKQQVTVADMLERAMVRCHVGTVDEQLDPTAVSVSAGEPQEFVIRVKPKTTDGLCVYEDALYQEAFRQARTDTAQLGASRVPPEVVAGIDKLRDDSLVWLGQYRGDYRDPHILACRRLTFDELELVSGPWPERRYWLLIKQTSRQVNDLFLRLTDAQRKLFEQPTYEQRDVFRSALCRFVTHVDLWEKPLGVELRRLQYRWSGWGAFENIVEGVAFGFQLARELNLPTT